MTNDERMASGEVRLGDWIFQRSLGQLRRGKLRKRLPSQQALVLNELVNHGGKLVTRDRLIHLLWPTKIVDYDRSLNAVVKQLRQALDDDSIRPRYIETIHTKGYRFVGQINGSLRKEDSSKHGAILESYPSMQYAVDESALLKRLADAAVALAGAEFGALFFLVEDDKGVPSPRYEVSGIDPAVFAKFPMPRNTGVFSRTFRGETIVSANISKDRRFGTNPPFNGRPKGHPTVVSYMGIPLTTQEQQVIGAFLLAHSKSARFDVEAQRSALLLATTAAEALDLSSKLRKALLYAETNTPEKR